jgi:hypothetical protein
MHARKSVALFFSLSRIRRRIAYRCIKKKKKRKKFLVQSDAWPEGHAKIGSFWSPRWIVVLTTLSAE